MKKWMLFVCMVMASTMASAVITVLWKVEAGTLTAPEAPESALENGSAHFFYLPDETSANALASQINASLANGTFQDFLHGETSLFASDVEITNGGTLGSEGFDASYHASDFPTDAISGVFLALVFNASTYESSQYYTLSSVIDPVSEPSESPTYVTWHTPLFSPWQAVPVPEPGGFALFSLGTALLALRRRPRG